MTAINLFQLKGLDESERANHMASEEKPRVLITIQRGEVLIYSGAGIEIALLDYDAPDLPNGAFSDEDERFLTVPEGFRLLLEAEDLTEY